MSLDKAIEHGRERRKRFYRAKAVSMSCRCHGSCPWCRGNRMHKHLKRIAIAEDTKLELEKDTE
jgi:hypothetical protein